MEKVILGFCFVIGLGPLHAYTQEDLDKCTEGLKAKGISNTELATKACKNRLETSGPLKPSTGLASISSMHKELTDIERSIGTWTSPTTAYHNCVVMKSYSLNGEVMNGPKNINVQINVTQNKVAFKGNPSDIVMTLRWNEDNVALYDHYPHSVYIYTRKALFGSSALAIVQEYGVWNVLLCNS